MVVIIFIVIIIIIFWNWNIVKARYDLAVMKMPLTSSQPTWRAGTL